jgi:hypothetical protein
MRGKVCIALVVSGIFCITGCPTKRGTGSATSRDETTVTTSQPAEEGEKKVKVVIKEFGSTGVSKDEVSGVSSKFCVEVSKSPKIDLVCAEDLKNLFQHQQDLITFGACDQEECLAKMGKILEADYFIQGAVNKVGEVLMVNINLIHGESGKIKTRMSQEVDSGKPEDLLGTMTTLAEKVRLEF